MKPTTRTDCLAAAAILLVSASFASAGSAPDATSAVSNTGSGGMSRECALRDNEAITRLERYAEGSEVAGDLLYEAFVTITRARAACYAGRAADGLALYDSAFAVTLAGRVK
jgi:hypothetical protein